MHESDQESASTRFPRLQSHNAQDLRLNHESQLSRKNNTSELDYRPAASTTMD
jgi:hypothetical protein